MVSTNIQETRDLSSKVADGCTSADLMILTSKLAFMAPSIVCTDYAQYMIVVEAIIFEGVLRSYQLRQRYRWKAAYKLIDMPTMIKLASSSFPMLGGNLCASKNILEV